MVLPNGIYQWRWPKLTRPLPASGVVVTGLSLSRASARLCKQLATPGRSSQGSGHGDSARALHGGLGDETASPMTTLMRGNGRWVPAMGRAIAHATSKLTCYASGDPTPGVTGIGGCYSGDSVASAPAPCGTWNPPSRRAIREPYRMKFPERSASHTSHLSPSKAPHRTRSSSSRICRNHCRRLGEWRLG